MWNEPRITTCSERPCSRWIRWSSTKPKCHFRWFSGIQAWTWGAHLVDAQILANTCSISRQTRQTGKLTMVSMSQYVSHKYAPRVRSFHTPIISLFFVWCPTLGHYFSFFTLTSHEILLSWLIYMVLVEEQGAHARTRQGLRTWTKFQGTKNSWAKRQTVALLW